MSVAIIGGGISGLTVAYRLSAPEVQRYLRAEDITVFEAGETTGGCLQSSTLAGHAPLGADTGAEASLFARPETARLATELGMDIAHPSTTHRSQLYLNHAMHAMPTGTIMGVPGQPAALSGLLDDDAIDRVANEKLTPAIEEDVAAGEFLAARLGDAVVDQIIDPLLGGVYAGRCRDLSLAATIPALLPAAREGTSVLAAVQHIVAQRRQATPTPGASIPGAEPAKPVFMSLAGGINQLTATLSRTLTQRGVAIHTGTAVTGLAPGAGGQWQLTTANGTTSVVDTVILAVPAHQAATIVQQTDQQLADVLSHVPYADSAVVTTVLRTVGDPIPGSGFLVPATEGTFIKAATHASNKWPWLAASLPADLAVVRMSVGRYGDDPRSWQSLTDHELAQRAFADWLQLSGRADELVHAEVQRWLGALPQYVPGHATIAADLTARAACHPGLHLTGSYFSGVGIPVCIQRAEALAADIIQSYS